MTPNNKYEIPFSHYAQRYSQLDPKETAERCGIVFDGEKGEFSLRLMGQPVRLAWPEFQVTEGDLPGPARILLMRYLLEGRFLPSQGKFLSYREMPWGSVYDQNFQGRRIRRLARSFTLESFVSGMEHLKAQPISGGDRGYEFPFLEGLLLRFLLWEGDEEFPPSAQILFSDNFPLAFTAEDMAVVGDISIGFLRGAVDTK